jgi:hypothetical protein
MDIPWHNWLVLGSESPNIFCFVLLEIIRLQETYKNILRATRSSGSPQYGYSLAQLARFGFRVSKHFLFCLIWDYKTSGDLQTYFMCWEILRKSSIWIFPGTTGSFWVQSLQTFFCFVLFAFIRLQETYKNILRATRSSGSPQYGYSLAKLARFGFRVSKHFLFCLIWDYNFRLTKIFCE